MLFQTLDDKKECAAIYVNGEMYYEKFPVNLTGTWRYTPGVGGQGIQYANLYFGNNDVGSACGNPQIKEEWENISSKLKCFLRSFKESKVDLAENCFFDLVPERFLLKFCEVKNRITEHVFEKHSKPENYDFLLTVDKMISEIKYRKLKIDVNSIGDHDFKSRQWKRKLLKTMPYVKYNLFGTKTGRLSTIKNSFPILTLPKKFRKVIKPQNNFFLELDYNAAELRTLLALSGEKQPSQDIHQWNVENVYHGSLTREEAKQRIFAWLYNPNSRDRLSSRVYSRSHVLRNHWNGNQVQTIYNREIEADKHHALNYIIQSTTSDLFLHQMIRVNNLLKGKKSFISFSIHDSLVIDFDETDIQLIPEIKEVFSDTSLGVFKTSVFKGSNYGEMKCIQ